MTRSTHGASQNPSASFRYAASTVGKGMFLKAVFEERPVKLGRYEREAFR